MAKLVTHSREEAVQIILRLLSRAGFAPRVKWWDDGETEIIAPSGVWAEAGYGQ